MARSSNLFSSDSEEESLVVDELVDGKLDVTEPSSQKLDISEPTNRKLDIPELTTRKLENRAEPSNRKLENRAEASNRKPEIRVGPSRKPEIHRMNLASQKAENRRQSDNHQDLTTTRKFDNQKLVDGKFDNLDERDEDEKAQEVSYSQAFSNVGTFQTSKWAFSRHISVYMCC